MCKSRLFLPNTRSFDTQILIQEIVIKNVLILPYLVSFDLFDIKSYKNNAIALYISYSNTYINIYLFIFLKSRHYHHERISNNQSRGNI